MIHHIDSATRRTSRHEFRVAFYDPYAAYEVSFRPLNPKTSQPWQASRRIEDGADVQPSTYRRPVAYSTLERALAARDRKMAQMEGR